MSFLVQLSPALRGKVLKEIGYTEATLGEDVKRLKEWIKGQPHLPPSVHSEPDCFFEGFLVGCKGDGSLARQKLDCYYSARSKMTRVHSDRDPTKLESSLNLTHLYTVPRATPDGCRLSIGSIRAEASDFDFGQFVGRFQGIVELRARLEGAYGGEWVALDTNKTSPGHLVKINPLYVKDLVRLTQEVYPARIKGFIIFNCPAYVEKFWNLFVKPFLKKKVSKRFIFYSDGGKVLLNHFPKEIIPKDLGGEEVDSLDLNERWFKEALSKREWFVGPLMETTDESKRLGKETKFMEGRGTFRQFEFD